MASIVSNGTSVHKVDGYQESKVVTSTVVEITESDEYTSGEGQIICALPAQPEVIAPKTGYSWGYRPMKPKGARELDPIAFPEDLAKLISWTEAYVERIGVVTSEEKKEREALQQKNEDLQTDLDAEIKRGNATKEALENAKEVIRNLECELAAERKERERHASGWDLANKENAAKDIAIAAALAAKKAAEEAITYLTDELKKKNLVLNEKAKELIKEARDHKYDHDSLAAAHANVRRLQKDLGAKKCENQTLKDKNSALETQVHDLKVLVDKLKAKLKLATERVGELEPRLLEAIEKIKELNAEVETWRKNLEGAQNKLAAEIARSEEKTTKIQALEKERDDANDKYNKVVIERDDALKREADLNEKLICANQTITKLDAEVTSRTADIKSREADIKDREKKLAAEHARLKDLADENTALGKQRDAGNDEVKRLGDKLKGHLTEAHHDEVDHAGFESSPIRIISVEYGGAVRTWEQHQAVFKDLYAAAASDKQSFVATNKFLGGDPWHGVKKSCAITYEVRETDKVITVAGQENSTIVFTGYGKAKDASCSKK